MKKAGLGFLVLCFGSVGCVAERSCPDGEHFEADACVAGLDGGMSGEDAPTSCEVPCGGDTPHCVGGACVACREESDCAGAFCVDGACVACRDEGDCGADAPLCDAGACVSCDGRACSSDQIAAELAAIVCTSAAGAVRADYEGVEPAQSRLEEDAIAALVCAYPDEASVLGAVLDAVRDGRTLVDLDVVRACLDDVRDLGGQFVLFLLPQCDGAFTGTVSDSGGCIGHSECASGYCALGTDCPGRCAPQVDVGMPCDDDAQCAGDAVCSGSTCRAPTPPTGAGRGATCADDGDCLDPLVCRATTSTCEDLPGDGLPCHDSFFVTCAAGHYCDGTTCRTRTAEGEPCSDVTTCVAGTRCEGTPARCLPVVALGAACDDDVACPAGTACVDDVCAAMPTLGEPCTGACYRGTCVSGTCTSGTVGAACTAGLRPFDALDPCGAGSTCRRTGSAWTCEANAADGAACGTDDYCDEPTAYCSDAGTCESGCSI